MSATKPNGIHHGNARPLLDLPASSTCMNVKIIDVCTIGDVAAKALFTPTVPGFEKVDSAPSFVFLLQHPSGQNLLFDLGIRKDWESLDAASVERLKNHGYHVSVKKGIAEYLDEAGIGNKSINAIIWSHAHWDHMGDPSTFDAKTDLVVGPGFKAHYLSGGTGNSALGGVLPSDVEGRTVREISFDEPSPNNLRIGQFPAFDYFHDGSLYLIDSPGHCVGHLCALVRTTTNPDTFVFLGGDAAHHCGEFRPSSFVPMPESITPNPTTKTVQHEVPFCPGSWFEDLQVSRDRDPKGPLFQPAFGHDMDQVLITIGKMQEYDGESNILVILAHDACFRAPGVPHFPETINDWKAKGLQQELRWKWIRDIWREGDQVEA